jgi:hypothetical protein
LKSPIQIRVKLTEPQAERLHQRIAALPFKVHYQEEQHGPTLVVIIGCTPAQEKLLRDIFHEIGAVAGEASEE